jgi:hypothetical protein
MAHLLNISLLSLFALAGCGKVTKPSVPDLSAYTNIPPGTPVIIGIRVQTEGNMPKWARDAVSSITEQGILVSISPEEITIQKPPEDSQLIGFPKESVSFVQTNKP